MSFAMANTRLSQIRGVVTGGVEAVVDAWMKFGQRARLDTVLLSCGRACVFIFVRYILTCDCVRVHRWM